MIVANLAAGNGNPSNAIKVIVGVNDDSGTIDTSTDVKSYTLAHDVSTAGSFTGVELAGVVYNFDPVLDGDNIETLTSNIEKAILAAGFTYDSGDVLVTKATTIVSISTWGSSLVFTSMRGVTSNTSFTAANSIKIDAAYEQLQTKGYLKK